MSVFRTAFWITSVLSGTVVHVFGISPTFGGKLRKNSDNMVQKCSTVPSSLLGCYICEDRPPICPAASFLTSFFVRFREGLPGIPLGVPRSAGILFLCNILSQCNIRSAGMLFRSGTTGLFYCTLLHDLRNLRNRGGPLGAPHSAGIIFFSATFRNNSTSSPPDLPDIRFFSCAFSRILRNPGSFCKVSLFSR